MQRDTITVERFYTEQAPRLPLKLVAGATGLRRIIREPTVNRPGLALAGFTRYFANKRLQVIGNAEAWFLKTLSPDERKARYANLFTYKIPGVVFSRELQPDKIFLQAAEKAQVPIFVTPLITMKFINLATLALEMLFAPRGSEIGSMVDIPASASSSAAKAASAKAKASWPSSNAATAWSPMTSPASPSLTTGKSSAPAPD
jgi:HPr kinase/phosphorylase